MTLTKIIPLLTLAIVLPAYAATEGSARVRVLDNIGIGTLQFEGPAAESLYRQLRTQPVSSANGITEKIGTNIACSEEIRMGNDPTLTHGEVGTGQYKVYRCGLIVDVESGEASPERVNGPQPGFSIGN